MATETMDQTTHPDTTVIVGAGSLGLWTAYHLAKAQKDAGEDTKIVVLEAKNEVFGAVSGHNAGLIHYKHGYHKDGEYWAGNDKDGNCKGGSIKDHLAKDRERGHNTGEKEKSFSEAIDKDIVYDEQRYGNKEWGNSEYVIEEDEQLRELGKYSFDLWKRMIEEDPDLKKKVNWRENAVLTAFYDNSKDVVVNGVLMEDDTAVHEHENREFRPDWAQLLGVLDPKSDLLGKEHGLVDPRMVGEWLELACKNLGVHIYINTLPYSVALEPDGNLQYINVIENRKRGRAGREDSGNRYQIACKKLLLAAGPWTPSLFHSLFERSSIELSYVLNWDDWLHLSPKDSSEIPKGPKNDVYIYEKEPRVVDIQRKLNYFNKIEMVSHGTGYIWVTGRYNRGWKCRALPDPDDTSQDLAAIFYQSPAAVEWDRLRGMSVALEPQRNVSPRNYGRAFRPSTYWGRPMMCQLEVVQPYIPDMRLRFSKPSEDVLKNTKKIFKSLKSSKGSAEEKQFKTRIFVCWGHGDYGLSMGPGSGKLMSQLMRGEKTDIDLSPFGYPEVPSPLTAGNTTGAD
ncbi:nucleotide-binding domain-containing protein [Corynespora cassiicola Philippines]|uniref:FAD-dependent oxidoreductase domain-containing protein 1 n=1 Tax=Corynespora cassiicola Philippines TaxID=1448308 RepID=A0A2T2NCE4_CORCC|nr:nucleotide-binding domain-containing protein [Corynespora cassiicola Philippines]